MAIVILLAAIEDGTHCREEMFSDLAAGFGIVCCWIQEGLQLLQAEHAQLELQEIPKIAQIVNGA